MNVKDLKLVEANEYPWTCPVVLAEKLCTELRDTDQDLYWKVRGAMHKAESAKKRLTEVVDGLRHKMHRVLQSLESQSSSVNSLGEVQGHGSEVDVCCALYAREAEDLARWLVENYPDRCGR